MAVFTAGNVSLYGEVVVAVVVDVVVVRVDVEVCVVVVVLFFLAASASGGDATRAIKSRVITSNEARTNS